MTDFVHFAESCGLIIRHLIVDDRWHRVPTTDHPRRKNGAYCYNGRTGAVKNYATMQDFALYRDESSTAPRVDRAKLRQMRLQAVREERQRHEQAARAAADMLKRATLVRPRAATKWADGVYTHPYLARKGFPKAECLILQERFPVPRPDREPMVFEAGTLIVPMRDVKTDQLLGVQAIAEDGTKLFIPGVRAKCAVFRIGRAAETWLCEGLATAYSVDAALQALYREACVLVCFSAGNIVAVAEALKGRKMFVAADHDKPNPQAPQGAGRAAAEKTGLPWVQPDEEGTDFNDLHQAKGIKAVRELLRRIV